MQKCWLLVKALHVEGSYAAYLDISHPEVEEFLDVRKPTGGDVNRKSVNLHHGVIIPDRLWNLSKELREKKGLMTP